MPPKKAEGRKSDVSTARFALKEDSQANPPTHPPHFPVSAAQAQQVQQHLEDTTKSSPTPEEQTAQKPTDPAPTSPTEKKDGKEKESHNKDAVTIEDLSLPKSIITRLAKGVLPANTQIQANAVLALSKSTTVFISYLAAQANDHTLSSGKKTILPADVFKALDHTEFEFMKERLEAEFAKFSSVQTEKRSSYRARVKAAKADTSMTQDADMTDIGADTSTAGDGTASAAEPGADGAAPRSKKQRLDASTLGGAAAGTAAGAGLAAGAIGEEHDDAETEDDDHMHDEEEDEQNPDSEEEENEDEGVQDDDETREQSLDDTQDALEGRTGRDDHDEALDGDESD